MRVVFADAGYWIALASPRDDHHSKALSISASLGKFRTVTTELVLGEVLTALAAPPTRAVAASIVDRVMSDPNAEVVPQTGLQFRDAFALYRSRMDKDWSLVDCASFLVMQQKGLLRD